MYNCTYFVLIKANIFRIFDYISVFDFMFRSKSNDQARTTDDQARTSDDQARPIELVGTKTINTNRDIEQDTKSKLLELLMPILQ